ncbi:hypothetical protein [Thermoproteus tenax]|uniref:hypothetical protein n=1 Tax=Thermoproteus tenax TaxID=2271 RepID=UPI001432B012|nr:hypothetical protein [Thermoproteus tenax]
MLLPAPGGPTTDTLTAPPLSHMGSKALTTVWSKSSSATLGLTSGESKSTGRSTPFRAPSSEKILSNLCNENRPNSV